MTISRCSAFSINVNVLLAFDKHGLNGALFSDATSFSALSPWFPGAAEVSIVPFTTIYPSLQGHKSDLNIGVLSLIFLLTEC